MPARPGRHSELHGNVADHARTALLLIDVHDGQRMNLDLTRNKDPSIDGTQQHPHWLTRAEI